MTAVSASPRPDPSRSGAVWVTGMGAFLLLAAAAVFTAVRWDDIPAAAKLAALVTATAACLVVGHRLRPSLPATASALVHLGAFLVPLDVTAIGLHAELSPSTMLLAQGLAATVTFWCAARAADSVVLRWAFGAAVVALAAGLGATTVVPSPLVLATFAGAALAAGAPRIAVSWAAVAGAAPILGLLVPDDEGDALRFAVNALGDQPASLAVASGLIAAGVLVVAAHRRRDVGIAVLGAATALVGVTVSWFDLDPSPDMHLVAAAGLFAVVQVAAYAARNDEFWCLPSRGIALAGEAVVALSMPVVAVVALVHAVDGYRWLPGSLAAAVAAIGWAAGYLRRPPGGSLLVTLSTAVCLGTTVALATGSPVTTSLALLAVAAGAGLTDPRMLAGGHLVAATFATGAAALSTVDASRPHAAVGVLAAVVVTEVGVRRSRIEPDDRRQNERRALLLVATALVPGALAVSAFGEASGQRFAALLGAACLLPMLAAFADRGRTTDPLVPLGTPLRLGVLLVLAASADLDDAQIGLVALVVAAVAALDALRLDRPEVALMGSLAAPLAVISLGHHAGLSVPSAGVALTLAGAVAAGLGALAPARWSLPLYATTAVSVAIGVLAASGEVTAFADALMITGGIGLAAAVVRTSATEAYLAGSVITGGVWMRLAEGGVGATEAYLLPVCALLLMVGLQARAHGASSWIAYAPAISLMGGAALAERLAGGSAWHALVAGSVGVASVVIGGYRRLAAPLLGGSALLVAVVGFETVAYTAALPTWVWLAAGGTLLLAAGIAMERRDLGPIETGRRLVDVISERYA